MLLKKYAKIISFFIVSCFIMTIVSLLFIDHYVEKIGLQNLRKITDIQNEADAIIVLGAYVFPNGQVSNMLADRLDYAYCLYNAKKATKIIVSGDHGKNNYDEVNTMRKYLEKKGVPRKDIFMDHAGFNTYDSIYRSRDVFCVKKAILVSQKYHVIRALYIAKKLGIEACGVASDTRVYPGMKYYRIREIGARIKAFLQTEIFRSRPRYLGKMIPIWKNGVLTDG